MTEENPRSKSGLTFALANGAVVIIALLQAPPPALEWAGPVLGSMAGVLFGVALVLVLVFRQHSPLLIIGLSVLLVISLALNAGLVSVLLLFTLAFSATLHASGRWRRAGWIMTAVACLAFAAPALLRDYPTRVAREQALQNITLAVLAVWWAQNIRSLEERRSEEQAKAHEQKMVAQSVRDLAVVQSELAVLAERARYAADLHDQVAGPLAAISLQCALIEESAELDPQVFRCAQAAHHCSDTTLHEVRRMIISLSARNGVEDLRRSRTRFEQTVQVARNLGTEVNVDDDIDEVIDDAVEAGYAVAQEAVANMLLHAGPCRGDIQLSATHHAVRLVARNSLPADPSSETRPGSGHGLHNMRRRLSPLGGTVSYGPDTDRGQWLLKAEIPFTIPSQAEGTPSACPD